MTTHRREHPTASPRRDGNRCVVAVVVHWRGRIGLFKRSAAVAHDASHWHCITGYLEAGSTPREQALRELSEETGLHEADLARIQPGRTLTLPDQAGGQWTVHTFQARTTRRRLTLNWEHDTYRWVRPTRLARFDGQVAWLADVLAATGTPPPPEPARDRPQAAGHQEKQESSPHPA